MNVYDIVKISSAENSSLIGKHAFITRLPIGSNDPYELFFIGDEDVPAQFLLYSNDPGNIVAEEDHVGTIVTEIREEDAVKNPNKTIVESLDIEEGSLIAGVPRDEPTTNHSLRVIRISDDHIIVTRTDDPTEKPIQIPLEQGIGKYSPYGFLKNATFEETGPETKLTLEKKEFIEKMGGRDGIEIVYTRTPILKERIEVPIAGGTRDVTRITGQIVGAIRAFSTKKDQNPKVISDLIRDTTYTLGDSRILKPLNNPIMVRSQMELPPWVIEVDDSRPSGIMKTSKDIFNVEFVSKKKEYHLYNRDTRKNIEIPPGTEGTTRDIKRRKEIVFEPAISEVENKTEKVLGKFRRKRVLLPLQPNECMKNPRGTAFRLADKYSPSLGLILDSRSYIPRTAPLYLRLQEQPWVSPNIINPDDFIETGYSRKMSSIPRAIIEDHHKTLAFLSPNIEDIMKHKMSYGGIEEVGILGMKHGFHTHGIHTNRERIIISSHLKELRKRIPGSFTKTDGNITFITPKGLYSSIDTLQKIYPETLGLINKYEALNRIIQIVGDHGRVLHGMLGADEYSKMESKIRSIMEKSEGERRTIREEMSKIKTELQDLESELRSLPNIAKHYSSKKQIDLANKSEDIILWDEHLDDDPDREFYYSDRKRNAIRKIIGELNSKGELDLAMKTDEPGSTDMCNPEDLSVKVSKDLLEKEIRDSYEKQNELLPDSQKIKGARFEKLVLRTLYGGRPVENGDVALITRYLRTAAYRWNGDTKKWVSIKDEEGVYAGTDIQPRGTPTKIFTHTLHLNKRYRQLSKMRDDKELLMRQPEIRTDTEKITSSLADLHESISKISDDRLRYLGRNPIIDEILFIHDRAKETMERYSYQSLPVPEDGEDDGRITKSEYRRARMKQELVTDIDTDLYQAGLGGYYETAPEEGNRSAAIIPDTDKDDEILGKRFGLSVSFLKGVKGRELQKRVFISSVAFAETIFGVPLNRAEIKICSKDFENIIPKKVTTRFIIPRGISMYLILIGSRKDTPVLLKNAEGQTPPPASRTLPSYRVPIRNTDSPGIVEFAANVIKSSVKKVITGPTEKTTFRTIQKALAQIIKTQKTDIKDDLIKGTIVISRVSPSLMIRLMDLEEESPQYEMIQKGLKLSGKWEKFPITHNPHPLSDIMQKSSKVLQKVEILLQPTDGVSMITNSGMPTNITKPSIKHILEKDHTTSSEHLRELFYGRRETKDVHRQTNVSTTHFPSLLGVPPMKPDVLVAKQELIYEIPTESYPKVDDFSKETKKEGDLFDVFDMYIDEDDTGIIRGKILKEQIKKGIQYEEDDHGALRSGFISFHDALGLAIEQLIRVHSSKGEPIPCERSLYEKQYKDYPSKSLSIPIYTAREVVSGLIKGIAPMRIEYSRRTDSAMGGDVYTLLTGKNTYFENVTSLFSYLQDKGINSKTRAIRMKQLIHKILKSIKSSPPKITKEYIYKVLYEALELETDTDEEDMLINIIYLSIISHKSDIFTTICKTAYDHTDLDDDKIKEMLNYDREKERQIFVFQMELLKDKEQRNIVRAKRALGLDLAGVVARDPKKFNAEYYELQNSLKATQETQTGAPETRTEQYGDLQDYAQEQQAFVEAPTEMEQIEGLDYDE